MPLYTVFSIPIATAKGNTRRYTAKETAMNDVMLRLNTSNTEVVLRTKTYSNPSTTKETLYTRPHVSAEWAVRNY